MSQKTLRVTTDSTCLQGVYSLAGVIKKQSQLASVTSVNTRSIKSKTHALWGQRTWEGLPLVSGSWQRIQRELGVGTSKGEKLFLAERK